MLERSDDNNASRAKNYFTSKQKLIQMILEESLSVQFSSTPL